MTLSGRLASAARAGRVSVRIAILAAACFLGFCEPSLARECAPPHLENTVKIEPMGDQGLMVVPISLNGVQFGSGRSMDLGGNEFDRAVIVKDVAFGRVQAGYIRFQVRPNLAFDGILSAGYFALFNLKMADDDFDVDFGAMRLNFFSADHCEGDVVHWPHHALAVVPVTPVEGHIEFPITLDGHPLTAAIDTGAPWTIFNIARAKEKLGFSGVPAPQTPGMPRDEPGQQIYYRQYSALSFEGVTVKNPLVVVRPIQFGGKDDPFVIGSRAVHVSDHMNLLAPDIIIGMEVLRHLHIYYAAKEHKLYITSAISDPSLSPK
jgi:hypothetical protein